jgi:hypothetical protein
MATFLDSEKRTNSGESAPCLRWPPAYSLQRVLLVAQTVVLDLRNRSVPRGTEANPNEQPLEVHRAATHLDIYLPLGSGEGPYDVRIVTHAGESILTLDGTAKLNNHITSLQVAVSLIAARPGRYTLQIRKNGSDWNSYPLVLR